MRYVNVTTIDSEGAATSTQLWVGDGWIADVSDHIRKRQDRAGLEGLSLLFAFSFDTQTRLLTVHNLAQETVK